MLEMKRVLKDTGSIYLHCDPTASHYLKTMMDAVFGQRRYKISALRDGKQEKGHSVTR